MCFSAPASFVAGSVLSIAGGATIKKAQSKNEIPAASVPLLFGIQQLIEGLVWLSFGNQQFNTIITYVYAIYAHVWWPMFIPTAILMLEKNPTRRRLLQILTVVGAVVGLTLLSTIVFFPVTSAIANHSIQYFLNIPVYLQLPVAIFYAIATFAPPLFSSHRILNYLGVAGIIAAIISNIFYYQTFASVWCFFSAILSIMIYWHFRTKASHKA